MITLSFPGLNIGEMTISPTAFTIGTLEVRWYGLIIVAAIALAVVYCMYRAKHEGISSNDLLDMAIFAVVFSVLGARLYYVLMTLSEYDSFLDVIAIWNGGLAI